MIRVIAFAAALVATVLPHSALAGPVVGISATQEVTIGAVLASRATGAASRSSSARVGALSVEELFESGPPDSEPSEVFSRSDTNVTTDSIGWGTLNRAIAPRTTGLASASITWLFEVTERVEANAGLFFQSFGDEGAGFFNARTAISRVGSPDAPLLDLRYVGVPEQQITDIFETFISASVILDPGTYTAISTNEVSGGRSFFVGSGGLAFSSVPEPAGIALLGAGFLTMLGRRRRQPSG
jgi:hypothetical protein